MLYTIRHVTRYQYSEQVRESVMEVRKQPLNNGCQRCLNFTLTLEPEARVFKYVDYLGNTIHHFDIPGTHDGLAVVGEAVVEVKPREDADNPGGSWEDLDALVSQADYYDMMMPSRFVLPTDRLSALAGELKVERRETPMALTRELMEKVHQRLAYDRDSTRADSPLDQALELGKGTSKDYSHILCGLVRMVEIPCRYVSGYVYRPGPSPALPDCSHSWVEALIPGRGWVGFDPTLNVLTGEHHIRTCIGRDYADVPPTRGVFRGNAESELTVAVQVHPPEEPLEEDRFRPLL